MFNFCLFLLFINYIHFSSGDVDVGDPCRTPNFETGVCVELADCPILQQSFTAHRYKCDGSDLFNLLYCCVSPKDVPGLDGITTDIGIQDPFTTNATDISKELRRDVALRTLMPSPRYCGFQYFDERFETNRVPDNFPWLVDVLCNKNNYQRHYSDRCSGVLINDRYVLTSKRCGIYADKVRLGAYNSHWTTEIRNYDRDIGQFDDASYEGLGYAESSEFIEIEEFLEQQDNTTGDFTMGLLRLSKSVTYSDFIRPICLTPDQSFKPQSQSSFQGVGWTMVGYEPRLKRDMHTFYITDDDECYNRTYKGDAFKPIKSNYQCLSYDVSNSVLVCGDDQGGPLMYQYKHQWIVGGIISSVYTSEDSWCTNDGLIDVINLTRDAVDWILENIRA